MTQIDVMLTVAEACGEPITPDTEIRHLNLDSLEFQDLITQLDIPDASVPYINTVQDLYLAATGQL